jgi:hypothetical protein
MKKYNEVESSSKFTYGYYNLTDEVYSKVEIIKNE